MQDLHTLTLTAPATSFYDAFLLGNGRLGAAVHGLPGCERVDLNLDTFWSGGPSRPRAHTATGTDTDPGDAAGQTAARWLPQVRQAVRDSDWARADELAGHLQGKGFTQSYQPLGALMLTYAGPAGPAGAAQGYERCLDMATAVASSSYGPATGRTEMVAFVSAVADVLVLAVRGPLEATSVDFDSPHAVTSTTVQRASSTSRDGQKETVLTWAGRAPVNVLPDYFGDIEAAVLYDEHDPDGEGLVDAGMGFAVAAVIQPDTQGVRLVVAAVDGFRGRTKRPSADLDELRLRAADKVVAALSFPTDQLRMEHSAEHRSWFDRMELELMDAPGEVQPSEPSDLPQAQSPRRHTSAAEAARFFHLGRYLLIASSRPGTQPANLQGIWNTDVRPGWSCNWTTNINLQMNYWPAQPCGLGELAEPFYRLVEDLAVLGRQTAQEYYSSAGWVVHHNTDIWGLTAAVEGRWPINPACTNWPAGTWWLAEQYAAQWNYPLNADAPHLQHAQAKAVVLGACELALSLLDEHPDGRLVTNPSTSPEHLFVIDGQERSVSAGTAMDQELVESLLRSSIELVHRLGSGAEPVDIDLAARARTAQVRLRPVQIGTRGDLLEWAEERPVQDRGHRHVSHLYGLYPGTTIDKVADPDLFDAAHIALQDRLTHGGGGTGWSQAWVLCLAARLGDAALVQHSLDLLVHALTSEALLDLHPVPNHPSGYRFQIDGNLGAAAGMLEALVHATPTHLRLLPALPRRWQAGRVRSLHTSAGHLLDLRWSRGQLDQATLTATGARTTTLHVPDDLALAITHVFAGSGQRASMRAEASGLSGYLELMWHSADGDRLVIQRTPDGRPEPSRPSIEV